MYTYANFVQNLHTYANLSMCTHLLAYAKFARVQMLENLHLPQAKCKSHFAYANFMQIWSCERKAKFARVSICLIVLNSVETTLFQDWNYLVNNLI